MKVEAIMKKPVNPPIEKIVIELTPEEARELMNLIGVTKMKPGHTAWDLWFRLHAELGSDAIPVETP